MESMQKKTVKGKKIAFVLSTNSTLWEPDSTVLSWAPPQCGPLWCLDIIIATKLE